MAGFSNISKTLIIEKNNDAAYMPLYDDKGEIRDNSDASLEDYNYVANGIKFYKTKTNLL
ncbi:hypothetical protein KIH39_15975 [Telmatocola sphagniphila]|uniref:Uncharacterized protein n=1 Tax=Telmatocola sphagniphila TaxID=1123043 RepID=A0A8E6B4G7_9BACT|nr:hypothetical protein [Telmatocola sphagniphila]QVL30348.1 hypothetical protein KIH39_15975 [Telmatocola sphagniphila]